MPSNENECTGRMTRSQSRAQSAASVATKPPVAKPQRKAATNASSTTKGRGGGRKSSSMARSTPAAEDANVVADDGSLILTPDDLSRPEDEQKTKIQTIFTDLGIQDITNDIPSSKVNNLRACLPLSKVDFQKFLKQWVPGYTEKSNDILTLVDHLRKAVFPAPSLALVPAGKKDASTKDDVSLRATFFHICRLPPQSSNGWGQNILIDGIQKQEDSEIDGGDYHYTCLTDYELIDKLQQYDGKKITYKKRWRLVKESWKRDHPGSDFDYTPSTANASHGRNVPVIAAGTPADAAPSLSGRIGSTDANVPRSSDTVAVVPPTPTPRNLRNGNGVAPPADNSNAPHPSESQAVAATSEISLLCRTMQSTNDMHAGQFMGVMREMLKQQHTNADVFDELSGLKTGQIGLQTAVSGLQTGQTELEGKVSDLERTVKKLTRTHTVNSHLFSGSDSSSVNNDGDESDGESVGLFYNLKSCESPQQELYQQGVLSGAEPERATSIGARRASDDQSEENDEESNINNESWKLDDEGQGVDGDDDDQMESDDNSDDEDSIW
eukprot:CAMPEP_0113387954 /NCGR_PEP_ID=MMETSP0013_2-20120614/8823_1 /TAXON_ID=2843 ORGANISM="Skeletonema costatum, Strain 1716" /NCGR_SAMPLE_ID=MMETSP0013_2 /ASSEMBLY_ACC=CAM_ASM_000158 /LENGTH=552 /DNA_ID=CAMNT_0000270907 /DNA_START=447 /DNA_END=2102 /DNA_ORIENTATION=- /assembly_acc=CAM_ASM_000158